MSESDQGSPTTSYKAISGVRWVTVGMGFQKIFQLLTIIILSRLLTPADFGLITVATLTLGAVSRIKQLGLYSALIQRRTDVQEGANVCFAMTGLLSISLYLVIVALSPFVATYFFSTQARSILNVLGLSLIIEAASGIQIALAIRNMQFRKHTIISSTETFVAAMTSIVMALLDFGVWALVWGSLAGPLTGSILRWTVRPWRLTWVFNFQVAREMLSFGVKLSVAGALDALTDTVIRTVVGRHFGIVSLGLFDFTMRLIHIPFQHVIELTNRVALPAYSQESDNLARIGRWHLMITRYSCLLMGCVAVPMIVLADPFIPLIFGEQWRPALSLIRILAPTMFLMPLLYAWAVHSATTNLDVIGLFTAGRLVITSAAFAWTASFGLEIASVALLIVMGLMSGVHLGIVKHRLGLTNTEILSAITVPLISCVTAGIAMLGIRTLGGYVLPDHTVTMGIFAMITGFAMLIGVLFHLQPETLVELRQLVRSLPFPQRAPG